MYEHEPQFIVDHCDEKYDVKGYFVVDTLINGIAVAVMIRESTVKVMASSEAESLSPFEVSID